MRSLLFVVLLAIFASSCVDRVCNLVGCASGITIAVPDQSAAYRLSVESAELRGSLRCVPAGDLWEATELEGDVGAEPPALAGAICGGEGATLTFFSESPLLPRSLSVTVETAAEILERDFDNVTYSVDTPNGPGCEPTCRHATVATSEDA